MLAINGMPDHVHILFGFRPSQSLSDLMQDIKGSSSKLTNEKRFIKKRSFIEEYEDLLKEFEIDYDDRFVFKPVDYIVPDGTS